MVWVAVKHYTTIIQTQNMNKGRPLQFNFTLTVDLKYKELVLDSHRIDILHILTCDQYL